MKNKVNLFAAVVLFCAVALFTSSTFAATTYTVQRGDTLGSIARRYGTSYITLAQANNILNPNIIYVGQQIFIPDGNDPAPTSVASTPQPTSVSATPVPTQIPISQPVTGEILTHIVARGDTIARLSRAYGVSIRDIIQANSLINPNFIYPGQALRIPIEGVAIVPPQPTATTPAATATPVSVVTAQPTTVVQPTATNEATTVPPTAVPPTAVPPTAVPTSSAPPVPTGANLFGNGSFEGGHYNLNGLAELQVPTGWRLEWNEGPNDAGTQDFRPETRVLSGNFLPPNEHPIFIYEGWHTFKVFKGYGPINVRLLQDITLQPGTYEFEATIFPDQVLAYENGEKIYAVCDAAQVSMFTSNGSTSGWMFPTIGQPNTIMYRFTIDATQNVAVGLGLKGRYGLINNGWFVDNLRLRVVQ